MRREQVDQGVQCALLIHVRPIVLHRTMGQTTIVHRTKGMAIVRTITCQDKRNVWKGNKVSRQ
jgi:hypothetical protein